MLFVYENLNKFPQKSIPSVYYANLRNGRNYDKDPGCYYHYDNANNHNGEHRNNRKHTQQPQSFSGPDNRRHNQWLRYYYCVNYES